MLRMSLRRLGELYCYPFFVQTATMGGKKDSYRPPKPPVYEEPSDSESEQSAGSSANDDYLNSSLVDDMSYDAQLSIPVDESQQPDLGDLTTQTPTVDPSQLHAQGDDDTIEFEEGHIFMPTDIPKFVLAKERRVHVSQLQWDKQTQLGQIRPLNSSLVAHYARSLNASQSHPFSGKSYTGYDLCFAESAFFSLSVLRWALRSDRWPTHLRSLTCSVPEFGWTTQRCRCTS